MGLLHYLIFKEFDNIFRIQLLAVCKVLCDYCRPGEAVVLQDQRYTFANSRSILS